MTRTLRASLLGATAVLLAACGKQVEVPPAHVGMVLTEDGFTNELVDPSRFRLDLCFAYCDSLVLVEVADKGMEESFNLFMPQDQLNMSFDIRFTMSVKNNPDTIRMILDRIAARPAYDGSDDRLRAISASMVYQTYGQPIIREVIRTVVADYSINEIAANRATVNAAIAEAVSAALADTPLEARRIAFADLQFPPVIIAAKEAAAEREIEIERARAEQQVMLVEMQTELERAKQERAIRIERAQAALEENQIIAQSVTQEYMRYRELEVLEAMAHNDNTVFVPYEALDTLGLQNMIFGAVATQPRVGDNQ